MIQLFTLIGRLKPQIYAKIDCNIYATLKRVWQFPASFPFKTCTGSQQSIGIGEDTRQRELADRDAGSLQDGGATVESKV